jgi:hypothetical protein
VGGLLEQQRTILQWQCSKAFPMPPLRLANSGSARRDLRQSGLVFAPLIDLVRSVRS